MNVNGGFVCARSFSVEREEGAPSSRFGFQVLIFYPLCAAE
jgi:hypothetical protein